MGVLDNLVSQDAEAINTLPIEKRAGITNGLPHELSISDIAALDCPDDKEKQDAYKMLLVNLCKTGELQYYGDIDGWSYRENLINPYPKVKGLRAPCGVIDLWNDEGEILYAEPHDCLIHKDNFKRYLQSKKQWPVTGLLANWWANNEPKAETEIETLGNDEEIKGRRNKQLDIICKTATELGYVDLLNIPEGGRAAIKAECKKNNPSLFSDDSFKRAWAEADKRGLIRVKNKEKYLSNQ